MLAGHAHTAAATISQISRKRCKYITRLTNNSTAAFHECIITKYVQIANQILRCKVKMEKKVKYAITNENAKALQQYDYKYIIKITECA